MNGDADGCERPAAATASESAVGPTRPGAGTATKTGGANLDRAAPVRTHAGYG